MILPSNTLNPIIILTRKQKKTKYFTATIINKGTLYRHKDGKKCPDSRREEFLHLEPLHLLLQPLGYIQHLLGIGRYLLGGSRKFLGRGRYLLR